MQTRQQIFVACFAGMLLFGMSAITLGSMAQALQARFNLDGMGSGTLFSILPIGILAGALVFGPITDRHGYRYLLAAACLAMGLGFEGIAWSEDLPILYASIFIFGFGGGILNGATSAVVNDISDEHKGSNLSLLGVFFGVGAVGMPLLLGILGVRFGPFEILGGIGGVAIVVGLWYLRVPFPGGKTAGMPFSLDFSALLKPLLLFISFFLFFQSGLEGLINNWTTTFLTERGVMSEQEALIGLSIHMSGMIVMRLLTGSVFRAVSKVQLMWIGLGLVGLGIWGVQQPDSKGLVWLGLFLAGCGLALGFPVLLGFVGERFARISGTAFSFAFSVALIGNMLLNYSMGYLVDAFGIAQYHFVAWFGVGCMAVLFFMVQRALRKG